MTEKLSDTELEAKIEELQKIIFEDEELKIEEKERTWCDKQCLARYLRARNYDLTLSSEMLIDTLKWRRDYKPDEIKAEDIADLLSWGSNYVKGFDEERRPLIYMITALDKPAPPQEKLKMIIYCMELAIASMDDDIEKVVYVIDLKKFSISKHGDTELARNWGNVLQSHYPERLGAMVILNSPKMFVPLYKIARTFIDPVTRDKVSMYSNDQHTKAHSFLASFISEENLPSEYGGKAERETLATTTETTGAE